MTTHWIQYEPWFSLDWGGGVGRVKSLKKKFGVVGGNSNMDCVLADYYWISHFLHMVNCTVVMWDYPY